MASTLACSSLDTLPGNFGEALGGTCKTCYGCSASKGHCEKGSG
nr:hypothetical protein Iba_chr15bCG10990 [Ipomoea batatas]